MKRSIKYVHRKGQTALEYMLILAVVGIIALASFRYLLPRVNQSSEGYYNSVTRVILDEDPVPINGGWCNVACPPSQGGGNRWMFKTCECPAPAFGGAYCPGIESGNDAMDCGLTEPQLNCVPNGTCSAPTPQCGQVTFGQNNCAQTCTRQGPVCPH